jgi:hypothetical protein
MTSGGRFSARAEPMIFDKAPDQAVKPLRQNRCADASSGKKKISILT